MHVTHPHWLQSRWLICLLAFACEQGWDVPPGNEVGGDASAPDASPRARTGGGGGGATHSAPEPANTPGSGGRPSGGAGGISVVADGAAAGGASGIGGSAVTPEDLFRATTRFAVVNPTAYGARGDGLADDAAALQNAFAAVPATGGIVLFPAGTYLKERRLVKVTKSHTLLWAPNRRATIHGTVRSRTQEEKNDKLCGVRQQAIVFQQTVGGGVYGLRFTSNATERTSCAEDCQMTFDTVDGMEVVGTEVIGGPGCGVFAWSSKAGSKSQNLFVEGNYIHHTYADSIHHTHGTRRSACWRNYLFNEAPSLGDDGIACVTYSPEEPRCGEMEWWNNYYLGGAHGRGMAVIGGEDISIHHNWIVDSASAGLIVASETAYTSASSEHIELQSNWLVHCPNGRVDNGHSSILVSGGNPDAEPIRDIQAVANVIVDALDGRAERSEGKYDAASVVFDNSTDPSLLPGPIPTRDDVRIQDTSILRTRDISFVPAAGQKGLYRIHLREAAAGDGVEERFEYVVRGTALAIASWLEVARAAGAYISESRNAGGSTYALLLSPTPLEAPDAIAGVSFEELREGDRTGTLSWLWARIDSDQVLNSTVRTKCGCRTERQPASLETPPRRHEPGHPKIPRAFQLLPFRRQRAVRPAQTLVHTPHSPGAVMNTRFLSAVGNSLRSLAYPSLLIICGAFTVAACSDGTKGTGGTQDDGTGGAGGSDGSKSAGGGGQKAGAGGGSAGAGGGSAGAGGGSAGAGGGSAGAGGGSAGAGGGSAGAGGGSAGGASKDLEWLPSWATAIQQVEKRNTPWPDKTATLAGKTLRQFVWPTYSGDEIRLQLSNERGTQPLEISKVHVAMADGVGEGKIDAATDTALTFDGKAEVTIPAGKTIWSDSVKFSLQEMKLTAITMQLGSVPTEITGHPGARTETYFTLEDRDAVSEASVGGADATKKLARWYYINAIEVMAPKDAFAISLFGDSITDGYGVTNTFERWGDALTAAINKDSALADKVSVLNAGMGANGLLGPGGNVADDECTETCMDSGLDRVARDILARPKIKWVVVLHGVNDILYGNATADALTAGYKQVIEKCRAENILVYGSPITPFGTHEKSTAAALATRDSLNTWVKDNKGDNGFDDVIDLASVVADPDTPTQLKKELSNDGLHPNLAGYKAMGESVDLKLFESTK